MGGSSSSDTADLGALPQQQVVSLSHGPNAQPSLDIRQAPRAKPAVHTGVQEAKIPAFWNKSSFRLNRAGGSKHLWDLCADLTADLPCELSVHFHCREKLNGGRLDWTPVEQSGPPSLKKSFAAGKQQVLLNQAVDIKKWPLEVYFKFKKGRPDVIPVVFVLEANNVQLVTHLSCQAQGTSLIIAMLKQKVVINGAEYPMEEVYGLAIAGKEHDNDSVGEACVICLTDPRNTVVLPCQHLCLCEDCAGQLQAGAALRGEKCPICRGEISGIRVFDIAAASA